MTHNHSYYLPMQPKMLKDTEVMDFSLIGSLFINLT